MHGIILGVYNTFNSTLKVPISILQGMCIVSLNIYYSVFSLAWILLLLFNNFKLDTGYSAIYVTKYASFSNSVHLEAIARSNFNLHLACLLSEYHSRHACVYLFLAFPLKPDGRPSPMHCYSAKGWGRQTDFDLLDPPLGFGTPCSIHIL